MAYRGHLPSMRKLKKLADMDGPFPIKNHYIVLAAHRFKFDDDVIQFLNLFPRDEVFHSRMDFIERCEELEELIESELDMPMEILHSPQG